jgi:hypothetical protein
MKKQSLICLLLMVLLALVLLEPTLCGQEKGDKAVEAKKLEINIDGKTLTIKGTKFMVPCEREDLLKVLGKPTRELNLANKLLTWDELGIFAYQTPNTTKVRAVSIALDHAPRQFFPKKLFTGVLKIDGVAVTAETSVDDLNQARKDKPQFKAGFDTWAADYGDTGVWLTGPDKKTKSKTAKIGTVEIDTKQKIGDK